MDSNWGPRAVICLGLTLLALCSTSLALECYECPQLSTDKCEHKASCVAPKNTCLKVTSEGKSLYQCWESNRCDINSIKTDFRLTKFTSSCCQNNLCNHSAASLPLTYLVLALAAVLLLMSSC
ncbi:CD59A glycoprotein-like [Spea bombifrons]|uniref:CD59A glycoprotein-like n=1 Tax=Spea bombifrons TaxID=233779 RepID=UPI00234AF35B|nr:CD59A glycoprotein-like [Spea bombifrons]